MKIIKDGRKLKRLCRLYGMEYDKEFKYITTEPSLDDWRRLRKIGLDLCYFSGCFYPYLVESDD